MTSYCAPCLADLALVRDAVTSVSGTSACVAHAVLLTHPGDTPQRRLTRLSELRAMAEGKLLNASAEDVPAIELLVQEYALAGAMDMTVPLRDLAGDRTPRPPKARRDRDRDRNRGRDRGPRPGGEGPGSTPATAGEADAPAPEPIAPSPEPIAPSPEPIAPAPEPIAPAPEPIAPAPATAAPEAAGSAEPAPAVRENAAPETAPAVTQASVAE